MKLSGLIIWTVLIILLLSTGKVSGDDLEWKPGEDGVRFGEGQNGGWVATWGGLEMNPLWPPGSDYFVYGNNGEVGKAVVIDEEGFIYVAGGFDLTTDFDPAATELVIKFPGSFLSKFDAYGNFIWVKTWDANVEDMVLGPDGFLYITGGFKEIIDLDPSQYVTDIYNFGIDFVKIGYLSKFSLDGELLWGRSWSEIGLCVGVSKNGTVYVGGSYSNTVDFEPGYNNNFNTAIGYTGGYLSEFSTEGDYIRTQTWDWIKPDDFDEVNDIYIGHVSIYSLAIDTYDNVFIAGGFGRTVDFDNSDDLVVCDGGQFTTQFLCKLNSSGDFNWVRTWGSCWITKGMGCDLGPDGEIYVTGVFQWFDDFDPGPEQDMHEAVGDYDNYVTKFDADGNHEWARTWGSLAREGGGDVAVADDGSLYIAGKFKMAIDLDPGPGEDWHEDANAGGVFIVKLSEIGEFIWAHSFSPIGMGSSACNSMALDSFGNIYLTGYYNRIFDFDPGPDDELHGNLDGWNDAYLLKLLPDGSW